MRPKVSLLGLAGLLWLALSVSCAPVTRAPIVPAPTDNPSPTASPTRTATLPALTHTPTPTATSSADAPRPVAAGSLIPHTTAADVDPHLALDDQGRLSIFFAAADSLGGRHYLAAQQGADGAWTAPVAASPAFQFLSDLSVVPDMSGRLCILWSGEQYDPNGNAVYGLWRNCQQADDSWQAQAQQPAITAQPAIFSPARAKDGTLVSVLVTPAGPVEGLYFSPISSTATSPLTGTLLSGAKQVLFGRLAIDAAGGYHAAWVESSGGQDVVVQARHSADGGKTWSPAEQLYSGSADNPAEISFRLAADAIGNVHLAWDADNAVHYRQWTAAGWGPAVTLSGPGRSSGVALAVTPAGLARAAWQAAGAQGGLLLSAQTARGAWSAPLTINPTPVFDVALAEDVAGANQLVWRADDGLRYLSLP